MMITPEVYQRPRALYGTAAAISGWRLNSTGLSRRKRLPQSPKSVDKTHCCAPTALQDFSAARDVAKDTARHLVRANLSAPYQNLRSGLPGFCQAVPRPDWRA